MITFIEDGSSASENTILYVCLKASFSAGFWKVEMIDTWLLDGKHC